MKRGRTNPGILIVDRVRAFQCNSINKDKDRFNYTCNERLTVGIKCRAKAVVIKIDVQYVKQLPSKKTHSTDV